MKGVLVLYDFDGTLTRGDSLLPFLAHSLGWPRLLLGLPGLTIRWLGLALRGRWSREAAKEALLAHFFGGWSREKLVGRGEGFVRSELPKLLRSEVLDQLRRFRTEGATVALVSASPDIWLDPFGRQEGLIVLCTKLEYRDGRCTGRLATPNCNDAEKANRVRATFNLIDFQRIIAFGNSDHDAALFALAHEAWRWQPGGGFGPVHFGDVNVS